MSQSEESEVVGGVRSRIRPNLLVTCPVSNCTTGGGGEGSLLHPRGICIPGGRTCGFIGAEERKVYKKKS